jgi:hypothetical protein
MPKSCIVCRAVASPDLQLQYCAACQSAKYCSKVCQRQDWRKLQHKQICKLLNVGHGDMQMRTKNHMDRHSDVKEEFEGVEGNLDEDMKRFFKLFQESTKGASRVAALKMKKIAKVQPEYSQKFMLYHSLRLLARSSNLDKLSWPNSPLLVLLQFVDPNVLFGNEENNLTPLHLLVDLLDPFDISTHENQLILAKQLIEKGANVKAVSIPHVKTTLHDACYTDNVTNLDFVELLLDAGADPNAQDHTGLTPMMYSIPYAPGAAKFLLNWPTTDVNVTTRSGESILARVRHAVKYLDDKISLPDHPYQVRDQFLLQRWRDIEDELVQRGP